MGENAGSSLNTSKRKITNIYSDQRSSFETIDFKNEILY